MSCFDECVQALDSLRAVSFRFRPKGNDLVSLAFLIARSFESSSFEERRSILDVVDPGLSVNLISLSGFLAEVAVNIKSEDVIRVALVLHVIEDFTGDYRDNLRVLVLVFNSSWNIGVDFKSVVLSLISMCSERSRVALNDFLLRGEGLNRLSAFGVKEEVVNGVFRYSRLC